MLTEITFQIVTLDWKKDEYKLAPSGSGVYQIYGTSPIYGVDTLLYVGQAHNLNARLRDHFDNHDGTIGRQPNKTCRFALVPELLLTPVEETLIIMHKPSFNSARLIHVSRHTNQTPIYIQNQGERGLLAMEVTNYYFLGRTDINNANVKV